MNAMEPTGAGELAGYYSARAREYDEIYRRPVRQADLEALRQQLGEAVAGRDVLELAFELPSPGRTAASRREPRGES
jgi:hypothetical protein